MKKNRFIFEKSLFNASFFTLLLFAVQLFLSSLGWFMGISIQGIQLLLAMFISAALYFLLSQNRNDINAWAGIGIFIFVFFLAIVFSGLTYDSSYDGNAYHKMAIGSFANGWNPIYETSAEFASKTSFLQSVPIHNIWIDHYAKGSWMISAAIYSFTGNIENAKAINPLSIFIVFGILNYFLRQKGMKRWQSLLVSFLASVNPITSAQISSLYIDGFLMMMMFAVILSWLYLIDDSHSLPKHTVYVMLATSLMVCINSKFTGLAYAAVFSAGYYFFYICVQKKKNTPITSTSTAYLTVFLTGVVLV